MKVKPPKATLVACQVHLVLGVRHSNAQMLSIIQTKNLIRRLQEQVDLAPIKQVMES